MGMGPGIGAVEELCTLKPTKQPLVRHLAIASVYAFAATSATAVAAIAAADVVAVVVVVVLGLRVDPSENQTASLFLHPQSLVSGFGYRRA